MKPTLCIGFVDTFDGCADFFTSVLSKEYNILRDDVNPDYLIFGDENFGVENLKYDGCVKIFYTGENRRAWDYKCHHGITFDHIDSPQHYRLPLYVINTWFLQNRLYFMHPTDPAVRDNIIDRQKTRFCGFVNSNPTCTFRNDFFHNISTVYKQVDSAGPLFNNIGRVLSRGPDGINQKLQFLTECKFSIAFENGSHAGYVTEKALESWYAGCVPIYWGSPTVEMDFNPEAIISWHDFQDTNKLIEYVKEVDNNPTLYREIQTAPLFKRNAPNRFMNQERFLHWFKSNVYRGSRR